MKCASHKTKCSTNCVSHKTNFSELAPHKKNCSKWRLYTKESRRTQRLTNELLSKGNHRIFENRIQEESKHLFIKMWYNNWKIWEAGRISKESGLRTSFSRIWPRKVASSKRGINNQKAVSNQSHMSSHLLSFQISSPIIESISSPRAPKVPRTGFEERALFFPPRAKSTQDGV